MTETVRRKWAPRIGYLVIYIFIVVVFFSIYGSLSSRYGSENVMPIFVGMTPLVVVPLILELRRREFISGWECSHCNVFIKKTDKIEKSGK